MYLCYKNKNKKRCERADGKKLEEEKKKGQSIIALQATRKENEQECDIGSDNTLTDCKNFLKDICQDYFLRNPWQIGGPGHTMEVNESVFNRRKHNVGMVVGPLWVLGGYDSTEKKSFFVIVIDRKSETLLPIIKKYILPGTTIISDGWKVYYKVGSEGYEHLTVKHSLRTTTNHVMMWKEAKQRNKRDCETNCDLLDSYLSQFLWRQKFRKNPFFTLS